MTASSWPALFNHPRFRKGWHDYRQGVSPTEDERDTVVYLFGRLMAAEAATLPLPRYSGAPGLAGDLTHEMIQVIRACPAFEQQMVAAQWLQAHGDPEGMTRPLGTKQGDKTND